MAGLPHMAGNGPFPEPSGAPSMGCGIGGGGGCCGVMGCMGQRVWGCGDGCGDRCGMGGLERGGWGTGYMGTESVGLWGRVWDGDMGRGGWGTGYMGMESVGSWGRVWDGGQTGGPGA